MTSTLHGVAQEKQVAAIWSSGDRLFCFGDHRLRAQDLPLRLVEAMDSTTMRRRRSEASAERGQGEAAPVEIGVADRRLDQLLAEERGRRAQSVDAGVRRLSASQRAAPAQVPAVTDERQQRPQGQPVVYAPPGGGTVVQEQIERPAGLPELHDEQDLHRDQGNLQRGAGLLQGAVQHTYQAVRQVLGREQPRQGLLGPLSEGLDSGVHGGLLLGGAPHQLLSSQVMRGDTQMPIPPRVLEYRETAETPDRGVRQEVNPFWSPAVRGGPGIVLAVEPGRGRVLGVAPSPSEQHVVVAAQADERDGAHGPRVAAMTSPGQDEVERLRRKILQEAEEAFAREVKKITTPGDQVGGSSAYTSATSGGVQPNGQGGQPGSGEQRGSRTPSQVNVEPPPGIPVQGRHEGEVALHQGASESIRQCDLPPLPQPGTEGSALGFGDWMTIVSPVMSDLSSTAKAWWEESTLAAQSLYEKWLVSTPLEKLRLKPVINVAPPSWPPCLTKSEEI